MKVGIIGGGVIGVSTGVVLAEAGHDVTIYSRDPIEKTTSWAAAALGYPVNVEDSERSLEWFRVSLRALKKLEGIPEAGVSLVEWVKYSKAADFAWPFWVEAVSAAFKLDVNECPDGYLSALHASVYLMDVDVYYPYMLSRFQGAGGVFEIQDVKAFEDLNCDVVVNCPGVWADDAEVTPARGQVVLVKNPGLQRHISTFEDKHYIYPRGETCILGGSYDVGEWSVEPDEELTQNILKWAARMEPKLAEPEVLDVRVGLRPLRPWVRLEQEILEDGRPVIHNYGHGGAGYTLSWGCAEEVLKTLQSL